MENNEFKTQTEKSLQRVADRRSLSTNGNKHIFKCTCGKEIIVMTNVYDNSNSGKGSCECGAVYYVN